ncbi:hypothetical protein [Paraflavitalea pollutisoli]|uniref:hypothetical protein n=1 Tax=Paraflavitalea pollutisoli TaxID=3034143 RepID=UPI0023EDDFFF|nr:hypothetical protein [Paraflavitalea sp. H1-2-19X]
MERKLIEQYGEDILSYRLRTARQKKRAQYEDFDKRLLKLDRERNALNKTKRNLGWEPLNPPYQKGWKRCFVLREDVAKSKHAAFYEGILKKINTYAYSSLRSFAVSKRKKRKGRKLVKKEQGLLEPADWHMAKLKFTPLEMQQFHETYKYDAYKCLVRHWVFNEPWRFVLKVSPNMITEVKRRDAVIEARLAELDDYLQQVKNSTRLVTLKYGHHWWHRGSSKRQHKDIFNNKSLSQILDMIKET